MCDPITLTALIGGAATLGSAALAPKPAKPPPIPAATPDAVRAPNATVRVGNGQDDNTTATTNNPTLTPTVEKRTFGKPVGGLGKSVDLVL